jgi:hypothetical protein
MSQDIDFRVVRTDSPEVELTPYIRLKEVNDVPVRYIPAWLKEPKIRETARQRIQRIKDTQLQENLDFIVNMAISKKKS